MFPIFIPINSEDLPEIEMEVIAKFLFVLMICFIFIVPAIYRVMQCFSSEEIHFSFFYISLGLPISIIPTLIVYLIFDI